MNICLLSYRGNPYCGGQGVYLYFLSRELAKLGHSLTLLVGPPDPWPMPWARTIRVESLNLWGVRRNFLPSSAPWRIFRPLNFFEFVATRLGFFPEMFIFSFRALRMLREIFPRQKFDVFHDVQSLGYGLLLVKQFRRPLITMVHHPLTIDFYHSLERDQNFKEKYYTVVFYPLGMQGRVIRRCDRVLTSSKETAREIERAFGVPASRIRNVANGLDTDFFQPGNGTPRKVDRLLFVGNTDDPKKGILYLLRAMAYLPEKITLRIVDDGAPAKSFAPDLVKKLGLGRRVAFTGKLSAEALREEYRSAQVTVVPSLYEGFGLPAAEAMACGTPVVATTAGALPEVVGEEGTGILVPPRDARALAQGIEQALEDEGRRGKMGKAGRERVESLFSWRRVAERTVRVYEELMP
ncbi:MAG: glycosyltransferase family 4 protein [Deltaproteobacteria bacterium]|nr:glycosyltransferase family 4 protein [Deltaproteobacteria bacterium]